MTQQFHSQVSAQEKCKPMSTEKGGHACFSGVICKSPKVKTTHVPSKNGEWTRRRWYSSDGMAGVGKKERGTDTHKNMATPENMPSSRSQTQKTMCYIIRRMWNVQNRQICRDRRDMWLPVAGRDRRGSHGSEEQGFFLGEQKILKLDHRDVCWTLWIYFKKHDTLSMGALNGMWIISQ